MRWQDKLRIPVDLLQGVRNEEDYRNAIGQRVATLDREELKAWLSARLHGEDHVLALDVRQDESPYEILAILFRRLQSEQCSQIRDFLQEAVTDLAQNGDSSWRGAAAHELLLLIQKIWSLNAGGYLIPSDATSGQISDVLRRAAIERLFLVANEVENEPEEPAYDLHLRVLQTLYNIYRRKDNDFWEAQAQLKPESYASVAFNAIARASGPDVAVQFLTRFPWSKVTARRVLISLPYWFKEFGYKMNQALKTNWDQLDPQAKEDIQNFLRKYEDYCEGDSPIISNFETKNDYSKLKTLLQARGYSFTGEGITTWGTSLK